MEMFNLENLIHFIVPICIHALEFVGIFIIIVSAIQTFVLYIKNGFDPDKHMIKIKFAQSIALALEFKLASEILKTVVVRGVEELYELGAIIAIRVILTLVIHWEIKSDTNQKKEINDK